MSADFHRIVQLPISPEPEPLTLSLAWSSHSQPTLRAKALIEIIQHNVQSLFFEQFAAAERIDLRSYERWESEEIGPGGTRPSFPRL